MGREKPKCGVCGLRLSSNANLKRHQLTHSNERPFKCHKCDWSTKHRHNLRRHIRCLHGGSRSSLVSCSSGIIKKYRRTRRAPPPNPGKFSSKGGTENGPAPIHQCGICGRILSSKKGLMAHIHLHLEEYPFECRRCGLKFKLKRYLNRHLKVHHGANGNAAARDGHRPRLTIQKKGSSDGHRTHKCQLCDWSFQQKYKLTRHMIVHSDERPFGCQFCDLKFKRKEDVVKHTRRKHGSGAAPKMFKDQSTQTSLENTGPCSSSTKPVSGNQGEAAPSQGLIEVNMQPRDILQPSSIQRPSEMDRNGKTITSGRDEAVSNRKDPIDEVGPAVTLQSKTVKTKVQSISKDNSKKKEPSKNTTVESEPQPCCSNSMGRYVRASKTKARMFIKAYQEEFHPFKHPNEPLKRKREVTTKAAGEKRSRKERWRNRHPSEVGSTTPRFVDRGLGTSNAAFEKEFWKDYFRLIREFAPDSMNPDYTSD